MSEAGSCPTTLSNLNAVINACGVVTYEQKWNITYYLMRSENAHKYQGGVSQKNFFNKQTSIKKAKKAQHTYQDRLEHGQEIVLSSFSIGEED